MKKFGKKVGKIGWWLVASRLNTQSWLTRMNHGWWAAGEQYRDNGRAASVHGHSCSSRLAIVGASPAVRVGQCRPFLTVCIVTVRNRAHFQKVLGACLSEMFPLGMSVNN